MRRASRGPARVVVTLAAAMAAAIVAGCTGPILANPPPDRPTGPPPSPSIPRPADPVPIVLPRDDGSHDRLTEWWYYTGHLRSADGRSFGFEYVIFRAERGGLPTAWAAHLAVTDEDGGTFRYDERTTIGGPVDRGDEDGFDLSVPGPAPGDSAWTMVGANGSDRLAALGRFGGVELAIEGVRPPVLHDEDGWIDFGAAGGSYYYSRTRMAAEGTLTLEGREIPVEGIAWFDHQWGDFIAVGGGGWDWFAVNLDDGSDLTLSLVRDADGSTALAYGTHVDPDGTVRHLPADAFEVTVTDRWRSPRTGSDYPAGWRIRVPSEGLEVHLTPTVADQELDTRATTGVVYWEGSQLVEATRDGTPLGGEAYVELTGYGPTPTD